jgi:hypothetical protein
MTYKKGTAQSISDLMDSWVEFATRDHGGWQGFSDELRGHMSLYATNLVASASWFPDDDYGDGTFSMHQAKSFDALADPDGHDGDSGLGRTSEAVVISDATTEDVGNWTLAGTVPTVTFGQADPDGFSNAYLIDVPGSAAVSQLSESEGTTGVTVGHGTSVEFYMSQPTSGGADITATSHQIQVIFGTTTDEIAFSLWAHDLATPVKIDSTKIDSITDPGPKSLSIENVEVVPVGGDWFRIRVSGVPSDGTTVTLALQIVTTSLASGMEFKLYKPRFYGDPVIAAGPTNILAADSNLAYPYDVDGGLASEWSITNATLTRATDVYGPRGETDVVKVESVSGSAPNYTERACVLGTDAVAGQDIGDWWVEIDIRETDSANTFRIRPYISNPGFVKNIRYDFDSTDFTAPPSVTATSTTEPADSYSVTSLGDGWWRVRVRVPDHTAASSGVQVLAWPTLNPNLLGTGQTIYHRPPRVYRVDGFGETDNPLLDSRCVARPGEGPFDYWFFATGDPTLSEEPLGLYAVIKGANGQYRHFGLGRLNKTGTYEGGEFVYGHMQEEGPGAAALSTSHSMMLDGLYRGDGHGATVRTEDLEAQADDTVLYSQLTQLTSAALEEGCGGFRGGIFSAPWGLVSGQASDVFQPMYPIVAMHRNPNYKTQPTLTPLGAMDGVAGVDITNIDAEARRRVGSETWIFFPAALKTTDDVDGRTNNIGVAYRIDD